MGKIVTKLNNENNLKEKYLYGEKNWILEENYYKDKSIYEGEYLFGKRHGKGKEYSYKSELKSEVAYLYDNKIKGQEYSKKGELKFEGEYLYGYKRKGKEYIREKLENENKIKQLSFLGKKDLKIKLLYEGEYRCGKKWNGKVYDDKGNIIYEIKNGTGIISEYNEKV